MRLKTIKQHYFDGKLRLIGNIYIADVKHGASSVKNGLCKEVKTPGRKKK